MRPLVITQIIDPTDPVLGFFIGWLEELARQTEQVTVICLKQGVYDPPPNVRILSLGKETGPARWKYLRKFFSYLWLWRSSYDAVFVHMNPEYVLLAGWWWRLRQLPVVLWYAHGNVPWQLRWAEKLVTAICTSTPGGCRLPSSKKHIVGQGIDTQLFRPGAEPDHGSELRLITVGRLSPIKDYETLIRAVARSRQDGRPVHLEIIGEVGLAEQRRYYESLVQLVSEFGLSQSVTFAGPVPHRFLAPRLGASDVFVNASRTGSLDKALLEAMSAGRPVLSCNGALAEILDSKARAELIFPPHDDQALASRIKHLIELGGDGRRRLGASLRELVVREHGLANLVKKILLVLYSKK